MILEGLSSITEELSGNFLYNSLLGDNNATTELLHRLMEQTIEPVVWGYLEKQKETDDIEIVDFTDDVNINDSDMAAADADLDSLNVK